MQGWDKQAIKDHPAYLTNWSGLSFNEYPFYLTNGIRLFFNECPFYLTNGPILSLKECPFYLITGESKRQNLKWRIHSSNLPSSFPSTEPRHDNPAHPSHPPSPSPFLSKKPRPPLVCPISYSSKRPFCKYNPLTHKTPHSP